MKVNAQHIEEIKTLIETGDVDLTERRECFVRKVHRPMTLDDNGLIAAVAATDDDDDDLFVTNVKHIEEHGWEPGEKA